MKRTLFVLSLAVVLLVGFSSSAFALHHGYDATSGNCRSCHAVHNATGDHLYNSSASRGAAAPSVYAVTPGKVTLTASSVALDLCEWCHVYGTTHAVYQNGLTAAEAPAGKYVMGMHEISATTTTIPDQGTATADLSKNAAGLDCIDCHNAMPHAANTNTNVAFYIQDAGATAAEATNAMCVRCHEGNDAAAHAGTTHPLVATPSTTFATSNYGAQQVAFIGSPDCLACHSTGVHSAETTITVGGALKSGTPIDTILPVDNIGWKFTAGGVASARGVTYVVAQPNAAYAPDLTLAVTAQKVTDMECTACHVSTDGLSGVGKTY